ncbi:SseB family protein [Dactylosporangium roseum]|uniref:SseB family protein n=1 Tax=Dactylosporangium roseum TaxID=47989 RepID=A0ABY5ZBC8_9ACTN|nr:SseB family protein [Dactylosporangium roseum]UWZ38896.1 SseB family protein [Dactylosporangium roseum]
MGVSGGSVTGPVSGTGWRPTTEAEEAMAAAVAAGDQLAYLQAVSQAALILPITAGAADGREKVTWMTAEAGGEKYVVAFTSGPALPPEFRHLRRSPLFEVVRFIADLGWGLAVDPGLPVRSMLTPQAVRDLLAWEPEWAPLDFALGAAVRAEDREAYLSRLIDAELLLPLPTQEELAPEPASEPADYWTAVRTDSAVVSRDVTDPEFPWWRAERVDGVPVILAFTSLPYLQSELGDREWVTVGFVEIVASWPEDGGALRLNPGGANGMELPAEAMRAMYDAFLTAVEDKNRRRDED